MLIAIFVATTAGHTAPGDQLCVIAAYLESGVAVRAGPSPDAAVVMVIGAGRMVIEFERSDGWVWAGVDRAGGRDGYVPEAALSPLDMDGLPCGS